MTYSQSIGQFPTSRFYLAAYSDSQNASVLFNTLTGVAHSLSIMQVLPKEPIETFSVRLTDQLASDHRRILQTFPSNVTYAGFDSNGMLTLLSRFPYKALEGGHACKDIWMYEDSENY